jgi:phosphonate transport system substrate-binding protein
VQSLISDGKLKAGDFRTVFQSEVIPRLTIGYVYNLKPALADQITKTILAFTNENGATDEDGDQPMKFAPVDYRQDFGLVRKIDDAFDPRFNAAAVAKDKAAPPTTAPSTT